MSDPVSKAASGLMDAHAEQLTLKEKQQLDEKSAEIHWAQITRRN